MKFLSIFLSINLLSAQTVSQSLLISQQIASGGGGTAAFDNLVVCPGVAGACGVGTGATSTFAMTVDGSGPLYVGSGTYIADSVTGVTFNGVALTHVATSGSGANQAHMSVWCIGAPTAGSHNIVISMSPDDYPDDVAISFKNALANCPTPDAHGEHTGSGANASNSLTPASSNVVVADFIYWSSAASPTANTFAHEGHLNDGGNGASVGGSSTNNISGAQTSTWTANAFGWADVMIAVK